MKCLGDWGPKKVELASLAIVTELLGALCFLASSVAHCSNYQSIDESDLDCGPNAIFVAATSLDKEVEYSDLMVRFGKPQVGGYSLTKMEAVAKQYGLHTLVVSTTLDNLQRRKSHERFACICYVKPNHFVVCADVKDGVVRIIDPPDAYNCDVAAFLARWNGEALLLSNAPLILDKDLGSRIREAMLILGVMFIVLFAWFLLRKLGLRKLLSVSLIVPLALMSSCSKYPKTESEIIAIGDISKKVLLSQRILDPIDFGTVTFGLNKSVELEISNDLSEPVEINIVSASCNCVNASLPAGHLPSGNRRKMVVNLSTVKGGEQTGTIVVHTEPKRFTQQIPIKWNVIHSLHLEPDLLSFGEVEALGSYTKSIHVLREDVAGNRTPTAGLRVRTHPDVLHATVNGPQIVLELKDAGTERTKKGWVYVADRDMNDGEEVTFPVFWSSAKQTVFSLPTNINLHLHPTNLVKILFIFRDRKASKVSKLESDWPIDSWKRLESGGQNENLEIQFGKAPSDGKKMFFLKTYFDDGSNPFVLLGISP